MATRLSRLEKLSGTSDYKGSVSNLLSEWKCVQSDRTALSVARQLWADIDSPVSLSLEIMARHEDFDQILSKGVDPGWYLSGEKFSDDYHAVSFLKKYPLKRGTSFDPQKAALDTFMASEALCKETNRRFRAYRRNGFHSLKPVLHSILHRAERIVSYILGDFDTEEAVKLAKLGPGATMSHGGFKVSAYNKLTGRHSVSTELAVLGSQLLAAYPGFSRSMPLSGLDVVPGNKLSFVPKTAKTDRCIAIEPSVNIYLQLGVGRLMARRLARKCGIDIANQADRNRDLARRYSLSGTGVTVDLSAASDTISIEVVRQLVPPDWFRALDLLRSSVLTMPDGSTMSVEKFSSMGNGFTFPLETVIFYALTRACADHCLDDSDIGVFGDDIICGQLTVSLLLEVLDFFGFKCNPDKTFVSGCFRESCGKDYWLGTDVRPFFLKDGLRDARDIYAVANGIRRLALRRNYQISCDSKLLGTWLHCRSLLPRPLWLYVPESFGDSCGLIENLDQAMGSPRFQPRRSSWGWDGWVFAYVGSLPVKVEWTSWYGGLNTLLYHADQRDDSNTYPAPLGNPSGEPLGGFSALRLRGRVKLNVSGFTGDWPDIGPWERIRS